MSISRYFHKTPMSNQENNTYYLDEITDDTIHSIIQSRYISDNVYGIEQYSDKEYVEQFLFTPIHDKLNHTESSTSWELGDKGNVFYELALNKPSFFPLDTNSFVDLFNQIAVSNNFPLLTQLLICKRTDNWREVLIIQYEDYLNGNDEPFQNNLLRNMQNKALKVLSKVSHYEVKRDPIDEIDKKILQEGYRLELRFVLFEKKNKKQFEQNMELLLNKLKLFNSIQLIEALKSDIQSEIQNRSFKPTGSIVVFSHQEVVSLLCSQSAETITETKPIIHKPNIIRHISNNYFSEGVKLLPYEGSEVKEQDTAIEKSIISAFKRVNISKEPLKVTDIRRGARVQQIECKIPKDKNFKDIKRNLENIQGALGNSDISLEIGNKPETVNFYLPCKDSELIYLKSIIESAEFQEFAQNKALPFILGEDEIGNKLFSCLSDIRHLLVAGTSGSGKSVFLNCILITFILYMNPDELALYLIDPKMNELNFYNGLPQVKDVITDMKKASQLLAKLTVEMHKRYEILSKEGYRDIKGLNKSGKVKLPYIVCVVDEYADLIMTNPEVEDFIQRLGQKARAAGIHLIVATQRPSSDVLNGSIKVNLSARIGFKMETSSDYKTVFGTGIPFQPLGKGDGCAVIEGLPKQYQRFQSPVITLDDEEWRDLVDKLKEVFRNESVSNLELEEIVVEEEPMDKLKRLIVENDETRVGQLQKLMGIRINDVSEMMQELCDEGFLIRNGRKYEINMEE